MGWTARTSPGSRNGGARLRPSPDLPTTEIRARRSLAPPGSWKAPFRFFACIGTMNFENVGRGVLTAPRLVQRATAVQFLDPATAFARIPQQHERTEEKKWSHCRNRSGARPTSQRQADENRTAAAPARGHQLPAIRLLRHPRPRDSESRRRLETGATPHPVVAAREGRRAL